MTPTIKFAETLVISTYLLLADGVKQTTDGQERYVDSGGNGLPHPRKDKKKPIITKNNGGPKLRSRVACSFDQKSGVFKISTDRMKLTPIEVSVIEMTPRYIDRIEIVLQIMAVPMARAPARKNRR